jgi:inner membrane protein
MDPVTHAVTGVLIAHAAGETANSRRAWWALTALAPDLDAVAGLAGRTAYYEFHRTAFHSLAGAAILAAASGALMRRLGVCSWIRGTTMAGTAIASHLLLDALTSFGSALWFPFSSAEVHWDLLFTVDAVVSALLITFVGLSWTAGARSRVWARAGIVALTAYVGVAASARHAIGTTIRADQAAGRLPTGTVSVLPQPPWAGSWAVFVGTNDAVWAGPVTLGGAGRSSLVEHRQPVRDELLAVALATPAARRFMSFARFPHVTRVASPEGASFDFQDLRFSISGWEQSNRWYGVRVDVGRDAVVRYAGFAHP